MDKLVENAKKVLGNRLSNTNTSTFDAAIKKAVQIKQRGSK